MDIEEIPGIKFEKSIVHALKNAQSETELRPLLYLIEDTRITENFNAIISMLNVNEITFAFTIHDISTQYNLMSGEVKKICSPRPNYTVEHIQSVRRKVKQEKAYFEKQQNEPTT